MKKHLLRAALFCSAIFAVLLLAGCQQNETEQTQQKYFRFSDLNGKSLGILMGTIYDMGLDQAIDDYTLVNFNSGSDMQIALENGSIDGYLTDEPNARYIKAHTENVDYISQLIIEYDYAFCLRKNRDDDLKQEIDEYIRKSWENGELEALQDRWFTQGEVYALNIPEDGPNGVLKIGTYSGNPPFSVIYNNQVTGYDLAIIADFCWEYGYGLQIDDMDFSALLPALISGKYDMVMTGYAITDERKESVDFSEPHYHGGTTVVVLSGDTKEAGFFEGLKNSFNRTFIREDRWQMVVRGIGITIVITICSAVLGLLLGFLICALRRSRNRILRNFAKVYVIIFQGLPILVILMILCYLIFKGVPPIPVAILGFGLNFAAYSSEMIRSGLDAVSKGQIEASLALGFSARQTFYKVTLPQAARYFIPTVKGELISLLKTTSIVGYVTIQDLTKVSDMIRSATYEAFFSLITTALIYFILSYLLVFLLGRIQFHILPNREKREIKGVKLQ